MSGGRCLVAAAPLFKMAPTDRYSMHLSPPSCTIALAVGWVLNVIIQRCLFSQVTEEDRLPKIMCGECTYKLDLISDFRDKAYKTETLLLSKLDLDIVKPEVKNSMQDQ